jgi:hypothetical protein
MIHFSIKNTLIVTYFWDDFCLFSKMNKITENKWIRQSNIVGSPQPVAPIVSSYTTTTVRELNDDSYSLYLDDLATDLYSSFHCSLHHSSSVIIVHLDSSHARDVVITWVLFPLVTIMMLVDRFMKRSCEEFRRWRRRLLLMAVATS